MGKYRTRCVERRHGREGHTLIELTIAVMFLTFSMGAVLSSFVGSMSMSRTNHETSLALDAAQSVIEEIETTEFSEIFARYNATKADDPVGTTTSQGFEVVGLTPQRNDPDGLAGRVEFPGDGVTLREDVLDRDLGMPSDLNADGDALDDASADYTVLPVHVTVEWEGSGGNQRVDLYTIISAP